MPETVSFYCPNCSSELNVPAKLAGVSGPCPNCHATISAPTTGTEHTAPELSSPVSPSQAETIQSAAPEKPTDAATQSITNEDQSKATAEGSLLTTPTHPSSGRGTGNWRNPVKNILIGFISVTVLAAATWGIAKAFEMNNEKKSAELISPTERMAPDAAPLNTRSDTKFDVIFSKDGKAIDTETAFPISNTVKPLAVDFSSIPGATIESSITPSSVIDKNRAELSELLGDSLEPGSTEFVPQSDYEKMMVECRELITNFLAAKTLEERLPMMFSERVPAAEMSETFADTILRAPIEMAKTITSSPLIYFGYEGPNANGISQQYFILSLAPREDQTRLQTIVVHMANHLDGKYRINADAFVFSVENMLEKFVNNQKADPLIAYLFLERCHFSFDADATEPPSGTFNVRLLSCPVVQSDATAIVNAIDKTGAVLDPVVKWGVPPRAAIVELKHESTPSGQSYISVDRVLKLNWLQSYQTTMDSGD